jgi:hypothetical protein
MRNLTKGHDSGNIVGFELVVSRSRNANARLIRIPLRTTKLIRQ